MSRLIDADGNTLSKADIRREFAERLKRIYDKYVFYGDDGGQYVDLNADEVFITIDDLLEEMEREEKEREE